MYDDEILQIREIQTDEMTEYAAAYARLRSIFVLLNVKRRNEARKFVRTASTPFASSDVAFKVLSMQATTREVPRMRKMTCRTCHYSACIL
jgi:hypothetical protein